MSRHVEDVSKWFYRGIWGVLTEWFCVPDRPPTLPVVPGQLVDSFQPSAGFLQYLKFQLWLSLALFELGVLAGWLVLTVFVPLAGLILAPVAVLFLVVPVVLGYLSIHLRYDTTWYVMTDRSLRIRRGIWIIHETTITFENVQNVAVTQGPLQRLFGISNVLVQTAGGGSGGGGHHGHGGPSLGAHHGLIEGISDALRIRNSIMQRLRKSNTAGLGDEVEGTGFRAEHIAVLREIRDALA